MLHLELAVLFLALAYAHWRINKLTSKTANSFQVLEKDITRVKRSMTRAQTDLYKTTVCQECKALLPEGTVRTSDGKWICRDCKAKLANV